jgi:hypothetical protein
MLSIRNGGRCRNRLPKPKRTEKVRCRPRILLTCKGGFGPFTQAEKSKMSVRTENEGDYRTGVFVGERFVGRIDRPRPPGGEYWTHPIGFHEQKWFPTEQDAVDYLVHCHSLPSR